MLFPPCSVNKWKIFYGEINAMVFSFKEHCLILTFGFYRNNLKKCSIFLKHFFLCQKMQREIWIEPNRNIELELCNINDTEAESMLRFCEFTCHDILLLCDQTFGYCDFFFLRKTRAKLLLKVLTRTGNHFSVPVRSQESRESHEREIEREKSLSLT